MFTLPVNEDLQYGYVTSETGVSSSQIPYYLQDAYQYIYYILYDFIRIPCDLLSS